MSTLAVRHSVAQSARPAGRVRSASVRQLGLTAALLVGSATTVLVVATPSLRVGGQRPLLHAQIATAAALVALLVAMLAAGRYRRRPSVRDLLLTVALALLGASNLLFNVIPAATRHDPGAFATWLPMSGRLLAAGLLAAAAWAPARTVQHPRRVPLALVAASAAALALLAIGLDGLGADLSPAGAAAHPVPSGVLAGSAGSIAVKGAAAALIALAAVGFAVRGRRRLDWFSVMLGWGTTLLAFAWLNYLLVPSLRVDWFYAGDALKLAAYLLFAAGAVGEILAYQRDRRRLATVQERSRVARELHDGVAQELVHVLAQARGLHAEWPSTQTAQLAAAAERALRESRSAISALRAPCDEPLHTAIDRAAGELSRRHELDVRVRAESSVEVGPSVRVALLRIVGEAVANAARHGGADSVAVELRDGAPPCLTVRDDGRGFDPDPRRVPDGSYGLLSMRERAESFGGELAIRSVPGGPTEIEVTLP